MSFVDDTRRLEARLSASQAIIAKAGGGEGEDCRRGGSGWLTYENELRGR